MWPEEQVRGRLMDGIDEKTWKNSLVIRKFLPEDLEAALEIDREVFGGYDPAIFTAFYEYHPRSTLIAEMDGKVAGFLLSFKHTPFEGRVFWLAVRSGYQGRGIGTGLMLRALAILKQMGAMSATLEVRISNKKAQVLYSGLGFRMTGIFPGYYSDGEAAIIMKRRL